MRPVMERARSVPGGELGSGATVPVPGGPWVTNIPAPVPAVAVTAAGVPTVVSVAAAGPTTILSRRLTGDVPTFAEPRLTARIALTMSCWHQDSMRDSNTWGSLGGTVTAV